MPAVCDLLLGYVLYKSHLVPKPLALLGIVAAFPLVAAYLAVMTGVIDQHGSLAGLAAFPVATFELSLGIWLIAKGFNPKAVEALEA